MRLFPIESIQKSHYFISQTLAFSNPRLLSSFVPAAFEDVLSGLPTSEQPYDHELRWGPSRARCSRFPTSPCLHRSDRSAVPVRPVRQSFAGVDRFDDRSRVLAHSSVLARFCVNSSRCREQMSLGEQLRGQRAAAEPSTGTEEPSIAFLEKRLTAGAHERRIT